MGFGRSVVLLGQRFMQPLGSGFDEFRLCSVGPLVGWRGARRRCRLFGSPAASLSSLPVLLLRPFAILASTKAICLCRSKAPDFGTQSSICTNPVSPSFSFVPPSIALFVPSSKHSPCCHRVVELCCYRDEEARPSAITPS